MSARAAWSLAVLRSVGKRRRATGERMAQFSNWGEVEKAVADTVLREAAGGWVVVGYHGTEKTISFVAEGTRGIEELKQHLSEDQFYYALIRVSNPKELAHSVKTTYRDIFFAFQGSKVPIMKRGKLVEHQGAVSAKFEPHHADLVVKSLAALSEKSIIEKSDPKAGSHIIE